jgi:tetratricopeptide (TPR) repeat protein
MSVSRLVAVVAVGVVFWAAGSIAGSSPLDARDGLQTTTAAKNAPLAAAIDEAFRAVYSLDEEEAFAAARRAVALAPDESASHRTLANMTWLVILYKRGAVVSDTFLSASMTEQVTLPKPPADLDALFKQELARAIELAEAKIKREPKSVEAHYDVGAAYALQASYVATVEGRVLGAMRMAKRAFDAQEYVLANDSRRVEAGLVAGTYRYMVASLSAPVRWMAYVAGFGGGKERGIALVESATRAAETSIDAKVALILIYNRERRYLDAMRITRELQQEFPKNRLFMLEEGSCAIRAGRAVEAEAALTRGMAAFDRDPRPKIPGEHAIWLHKRAVARIAQRHLDTAQADLDLALRSQPIDWTRGRLQLEIGRIADLRGRRPEAVSAYRQARALCAENKDAVCANEAQRFTSRPYK